MNDRQRWRLCCAGVVGGLLVALTPGEAAAEPPPCQGKDLVAELAKTNGALAATVKAAGDAVPNTRANLWRIERDGTAPSHLFGTLHLTDPRITAMPEPARAALAQARTVAVEVAGINFQAMSGAMQSRRDLVAMPPGEGLSRHLSAREVERLDQAAREMGASAAVLDQAQPWFIVMMLMEPPCERARADFGLEVLDARIEAAGRKQGADVVGLETIDEQLDKFTSIPLELQLVWLKAALMGADGEDHHETLVRLYLERRLGETWPLMLAMSEDKHIARRFIDDVQRRLLDERNLVMRDRALPFIEKGGAFIAVGALHLSGDAGLVALLRLAGYQVTPVD